MSVSSEIIEDSFIFCNVLKELSDRAIAQLAEGVSAYLTTVHINERSEVRALHFSMCYLYSPFFISQTGMKDISNRNK